MVEIPVHRDEEFPVRFRGLIPNDISFICSSYLKSLREQYEYALIPKDLYFKNQKQILYRILEKPNTVLIACNPEDQSQIFGYVLGENIDNIPICHWIYTKFPYRKLGVANKLFKAAFGDEPEVVFISHYQAKIYNKYKDRFKLVYNPYLKG